MLKFKSFELKRKEKINIKKCTQNLNCLRFWVQHKLLICNNLFHISIATALTGQPSILIFNGIHEK